MKATLEEYLEMVRTCNDDDTFRYELGVHDNFPIHLYGEEDLFSRVVEAFRDSPDWVSFYEKSEEGVVGFNYKPGTVQVYVREGFCAFMRDKEYKINGQDPAVTLTVHPAQYERQYQGQGSSYQGKQMEGVSSSKALALVIIGLGEYIMREKIPAALRNGEELDIIYNPQGQMR